MKALLRSVLLALNIRCPSTTVLPFQPVNRRQHLVLIVYCAVLVYCFLWIPWRVQLGIGRIRYERVGYGWLWAGPPLPPPSPPIVYDPPIKDARGWTVVAEEDLGPTVSDPHAEPDVGLIFLRFLAATAIATAGWFFIRLRSQVLRA
jgi:hypothetical protein